MSEFNVYKRTLLLASVLLMYSGSAAAAQVANQILEEVIVATDATAVRMNFEDPPPNLTRLDVTDPTSNTKACEKTARGLFCLVGNKVLRWPSPADLAAPPPSDDGTPEELDCRDPALVSALNLDTKKADTCTALTANATGTKLWLGAKNKGKTHTLIEAVLKDEFGDCPDMDWTALGSNYCAQERATGRPLLVKIAHLDGTLGLGPGVLLLEERKTAVVYNEATAAVTEIAKGKSDWKLIGNEQLLAITAVDWLGSPHILATTTKNRILAVEVAAPVGFPVFDFAVHRGSLGSPQQCDFNEQHYDITTGTDSGLVFATDRNFCLVVALELQALNGAFELNEVQTLSTDTGEPNEYPPSSVTASPGISINLANCAGQQGCNLIKNAAMLTNVQLVPGLPTGMTLYQIIDIPDCRYIPTFCTEQGFDLAAVVKGPPGNPAAQQLNVTPLIPPEVINALEIPLPEVLLISRQYRAQFQNEYFFDAFLGITEPGVQFQGVFNGEYFVDILTGEPDLGCPLSTDMPPPETLGDLLAWDIVTTVSENFVSGTLPDEHRDMLINTDCGSSRTSGGRWSLIPYNLEVTWCTFNEPGDVWQGDGSCPVNAQGDPDDAVFAKLLLALYGDLGKAVQVGGVACADVDDAGDGAPLSITTCTNLSQTHANGKDKLDKCWEDLIEPRKSAAPNNCQAFISQLTNFSNTLAGAAPNGSDPANRKGELQVRVEVLFHLYFERVQPSIPANGFVEPQPLP